MKRLFAALALLLAACAAAPATAQSWSNVERVVAFGDMHGDYAKFEGMLSDAGLIDAQGNWNGGRTHFVQLGDVPDRGADTRRILDHLMRLEPQARRVGGMVHALIGNHEAMNIKDDLRYVSAGEYAAFAGPNSARLRDALYQAEVRYLTQNPPAAGLPAFDAAHRAQWDAAHPLGFVEHRQAWSLRGTYGRWVSRHDAVIRINDTLYMHGGIGPAYAGYTAETLNNAIRSALADPDEPDPANLLANILWNEQGPLWYRGLAQNDEATEAANLAAVLQRHGVTRIVLGHTKAAPLVLPRFGGRVILTDIAVLSGAEDPHAFLIQEGGALTVVHRNQRTPLAAATPQERCTYLAAISAIEPQNAAITALRAGCTP